MTAHSTGLIGLTAVLSLVAAAAAHAADTTLVYDKDYQCGNEIIQVAYCRRDSDRPGSQPTADAQNYCQVYYPSRPKTNIGGMAFGTELRTDLEKKLRACGALAGGTMPAVAKSPAAPVAANTAPAARALSSAEQQALAAYKTGAALAAAKDHAGAIDAFRKSIAVHPLPAAWNDLGNSYYSLGRYAEAIAAYRESIKLNPANSNPQAGAGMSCFASQQYAEAMPFLREALRLKPDIDWASNMLGDAHFKLRQYEDASRAYREAVRLKPGEANYHANLGAALNGLERYADAATSAREAVRLNPDLPGANNVLGNALFGLKQYPEAIKAYQQALRLDPSVAVYHFNLGSSYRLVKQSDKALPVFLEAVRLDPKFEDAWNYLGLSYDDLKRDAEALTAFQKASSLNPQNNTYVFNIGFALTQLGRLQEASQRVQVLASRGAAEAKQLQENIDRMSGRITLATKPSRPAGARNPKIELVWVAPGSFTMGGGFTSSQPAHPVTISSGFFIGKYEVTQAQWKAVMGGNPSSFRNCGDNCPVEQVTWDAAQVFLKFLNDGNDGYVYRLPSEAEWEFAFRAGTAGERYDEGEIGWHGDNSGGTTHPVGQLRPNALGLYDIAGNVGEWCSDWFHENYQGAPADGRPWLEGGDEKMRVTRGGTFYAPFRSMNATTRLKEHAENASRTNGLRVVAVRKSP